MKRRDFNALLTFAVVAWPFAAGAQLTGKTLRIGMLSPGLMGLTRSPGAFYQGLPAPTRS